MRIIYQCPKCALEGGMEQVLTHIRHTDLGWEEHIRA